MSFRRFLIVVACVNITVASAVIGIALDRMCGVNLGVLTGMSIVGGGCSLALVALYG
jgi:hypothetical protein